MCSMSELGTMIQLSKLIKEYNGSNKEEIEKKQKSLLAKQKATVYCTIIVSVILLIIITWINVVEGRGDTNVARHNNYNWYFITTSGLFLILSIMICIRLA